MITLIILAYIGNVFLNRWLDYKFIKIRQVFIWFIPLVTTVVFLLYSDFNIKTPKIENRFYNWFIGKHW